MRAARPALLVVVLALAGCFGADESPEPDWRAAEDAGPVTRAAVTPVTVPASPAPVVANAPQAQASNSTTTTPTPPESNGTRNETAAAPPPAPSQDKASTATNATASNETAPASSNASKPAQNASVVLHRSTHNFGNASGLMPRSASESFDVPAGYARITVDLTFTRRGNASLVDRDASVSLLAPGGFLPVDSAEARPGTTARLEAEADPGAWTLRFDGRAPVEATIVVTAFRAAS